MDDTSFDSLGSTYESKSKLSEAERTAVALTRRAGENEEDQQERPLSVAARHAASSARVLTASKTYVYESGMEGLCLATSPSGNLIAVGARGAKILLINPQTMVKTDTLIVRDSDDSPDSVIDDFPAACTSLCFRPATKGEELKNVLVAAMGSKVVHVHAGTGKVLGSVTIPNNEFANVVAVRGDGQMFAAAGSDRSVRVYDEATGSLVVELEHGDGFTTGGHSNGVFALAFKPDNPQVLLSGGWDHTLQVWDCRAQRSVRSISGPYLCGESMDLQGNTILTGSWRDDTPLQLWDFGSGRLLTNLSYPPPMIAPTGANVGPGNKAFAPTAHAAVDVRASGRARAMLGVYGHPRHLYAAKFGAGSMKGCIYAGGSGDQPVFCTYQQGVDGSHTLTGVLPTPSGVQAMGVIDTEKSHLILVACTKQILVLAA